MWVSGSPKHCSNPDCASLEAPRVRNECYDAIDRLVVGRAACEACGTAYLFTRNLTKAEALVAQVHHAPLRTTRTLFDGEVR